MSSGEAEAGRQTAAWVGRAVDRVDARPLVDGSGQFVGDLRPAGLLHAAVVRSTTAAGRLIGIDTSRAAEAPGVLLVVTADDLAGVSDLPPPSNSVGQPRFAAAFDVTVHPRSVPLLAAKDVRYVGEPVALVVATSRALAEDAVELVDMDVEPTSPVLDPQSALDPTSGLTHPDSTSNLGVRLSVEKGETPHEVSGGVVVEAEYTVGRQAAVSMEGRGVLAEPEPDGRITVWSSTQVPFILRRLLCEATGWSEREVRVRTPHVGGGFGPKAVVYPEEVLVPWVARRLGRPVAWVEDRYENLTCAAQARDQVHRVRLSVDGDGRIVRFEDDFIVDLGVHNPWMLGVVANTAVHLLGPYRIPAVRFTGTGVFTNKTPTSQYRGAGRPEAAFALERALDLAARRLGIEPVKIREVNLLGPTDLPYPQGLPYRDGVDIVYDGQDYTAVLRAALGLLPESEVHELRARCGPDQRVGVGAACYMEATARGPHEPETATATLLDDGRVRVATGTGPSGQAHATTFAQVAAQASGRDIADIEVRTGDTDTVPQGLGSFASRGAVVAGNAVQVAVTALVEQARATAADLMGTDDPAVVPAGFRDHASGRTCTWRDIGAAAAPTVTRSFAPPTVTWTMGVHLVAVRVDIETGGVEVLRYAVAHETGPSLNPRIVDGQVRGGVAQGIGSALLEAVRHDRQGQPLTATLADYLLPESTTVPEVRLAHLEVPSKLNPLGIRGVGESGIIASSAAIAAAVEQAVLPVDVHVRRTPLTADLLLDLLEEATA